MNEKNIESKNVVKINGDDNLSSSDKYTIILKLYKGLQDNLETLEKYPVLLSNTEKTQAIH